MVIALCGDAHLTTGKTGKLDSELGLDQTLVDRYRAFRWCVQDAVEQGAELLLIGGDAFDSPTPTPTEWDLALRALGPAEGVECILLGGNHEMPKAVAETNPIWTIASRPRTKIADRPIGLPASDGSLAIACCPWPNRQQLLASRPDLTPMGAEAAIRECMMDVLRGLAADRIPGVPSILLGHFSVDLATAGSESRLMALGSEWMLNAHGLADLGFDAVLLGHIHKPQQVADLPMWYAGSPCQLDFGEREDRSGYWLFEIADIPMGCDQVQEAVFRENPENRKHLKFDLAEDAWPPIQDLHGAHVWLTVPPEVTVDEDALTRSLQESGAHDWRIDHPARPVEARRETPLTEGMGRWEQLEAYLREVYPEEDIPALMEEAQKVEAKA